MVLVKSKYTKFFKLLLSILLLLVVLSQFTPVQKTIARLSTSTYVSTHYSHMDLRYQAVEFSPQFGDYFVRYTDKDGTIINFMVTPKFMPILISYDPLNPPMSFEAKSSSSKSFLP